MYQHLKPVARVGHPLCNPSLIPAFLRPLCALVFCQGIPRITFAFLALSRQAVEQTPAVYAHMQPSAQSTLQLKSRQIRAKWDLDETPTPAKPSQPRGCYKCLGRTFQRKKLQLGSQLRSNYVLVRRCKSSACASQFTTATLQTQKHCCLHTFTRPALSWLRQGRQREASNVAIRLSWSNLLPAPLHAARGQHVQDELDGTRGPACHAAEAQSSLSSGNEN